MNKWKVASIVLGIILITMIIYDINSYERFGDYKILKEDLKGFTKLAQEKGINSYKLCSIETAECFMVEVGK